MGSSHQVDRWFDIPWRICCGAQKIGCVPSVFLLGLVFLFLLQSDAANVGYSNRILWEDTTSQSSLSPSSFQPVTGYERLNENWERKQKRALWKQSSPTKGPSFSRDLLEICDCVTEARWQQIIACNGGRQSGLIAMSLHNCCDISVKWETSILIQPSYFSDVM